MKRFGLWMVWMVWMAVPAGAQQVMYSNLKSLVEQRGDTVSILKVEKRSKNQIYLLGGNDYRISAIDNPGMSRYLKSRCYAVQVDSVLYMNCRKMRYKRYRFGHWYAKALYIAGHVFYAAQPVGQIASSTSTPPDATRLGGEVGNAIHAAGLTNARVYYELDLTTGRSLFVGKERMMQLLEGNPEQQALLQQEQRESAEIIGRYLHQLK